jgi:hypothetical protein
MAWLNNFVGNFRQLADDDVDGLLTVLMFCFLDEGTRQNYRQWVTDQIVNSKGRTPHEITMGLFSNLVEQAGNRERQGMRPALDQTLWGLRNENA